MVARARRSRTGIVGTIAIVTVLAMGIAGTASAAAPDDPDASAAALPQDRLERGIDLIPGGYGDGWNDEGTGLAVSADGTVLYHAVGQGDDPILVRVSSLPGGETLADIDITAYADGTLGVGDRPNAMTLSPDGSRLYVALSGRFPPPPGPNVRQSGVVVIDTVTRAPDAETPFFPGTGSARDIVVSPDGKTLFVPGQSRQGNDEVAVMAIDLDTGTQGLLAQDFSLSVPRLGGGMVLDPVRGEIVFTLDDGLWVLDIDSREASGPIDIPGVGEVENPYAPSLVAVSPDGRYAAYLVVGAYTWGRTRPT